MVKTSTKRLDDILQWVVHQSFCFDSQPIKAGADALAVGDSVFGKLLVKSGADWVLVDATSGAALTAASEVAICLRQQKITAAVAANGAIGGADALLLVRGPALVQKEDFEALLPAEAVEATVQAALEAVDIRYVTDPGLAYSPIP